MRRHMMTPLLVIFAATVAQAQDTKPSQPAADFASIKKALAAEELAFRDVAKKRFDKAKAEGKRFYIPFEESPPAKFAQQFLEFAEQHPDDSHAFEAVENALNGSFTNPPTRQRTLKLLRTTYLKDPRMKRIVPRLVISPDDESRAMVHEVIAQSPDREVRVVAYKALIQHTEALVKMAERLEADPSLRKDVEANEGKAYLDSILSRAERGKADLKSYQKVARETYGDRFPDLEIGKPAPALVGRTLDDKETKLSDYRGKVVVLDIWATWCGPCREMIPHEREMVERLKDKPFALISISVDEEKETLTSFLSREKMPWTHWWNGSSGKIIDSLDIDHYPTIFVLDANGVIRGKELRGERLEETVNKLIAEIEPKAAK